MHDTACHAPPGRRRPEHARSSASLHLPQDLKCKHSYLVASCLSDQAMQIPCFEVDSLEPGVPEPAVCARTSTTLTVDQCMNAQVYAPAGASQPCLKGLAQGSLAPVQNRLAGPQPREAPEEVQMHLPKASQTRCSGALRGESLAYPLASTSRLSCIYSACFRGYRVPGCC